MPEVVAELPLRFNTKIDITLIENGYEPVVVSGKAPAADGWQTGPVTAERIVAERAAFPGATNIGLRTGPLAPVDIDLTDTGHVAAVKKLAFEILGRTDAERIGKKGAALCYRNPEPIRKITVAAKGARIEILGIGQQLVVYGIHPETGKSYQWTGDDFNEPLSCALKDLPPVRPDKLREFARRAATLLEQLGYAGARVSGDGAEREPAKGPTNVKPDDAGNVMRAVRHLKSLPLVVEGGGSDDAAFKAAAVLRDLGLSEGKAVEIMMEHFQCEPKELEWIRSKVANAYRYSENEQGAYARPPMAETHGHILAKSPEPEAKEERRDLVLDSRNPRLSAIHFLRHYYLAKDRVMRLRHYQGEFLVYTGTHYATADDARMRSEIYAFLDAAFEGDMPFKPNMAKVANVLDALKGYAHLDSSVRAPSWIDANDNSLDDLIYDARHLLSCKNGLLYLPTRKLLKHTPRLFTQNALEFDYDPKASEPKRWLRFLDSIWGDDREAIDTLQEIFGYLLSGELKHQKVFLIIGPKRSGKGTIARVLTQLLGQGNVIAPTIASLSDPFGLQPFIGKRAAIISDARLSARADQAVVAERLLSISGEDGQTVNRKHIGYWTGQLLVRFLILSNELPRIGDASSALASRFVLLVQQKSFLGREDKALGERLASELPGILNWALNGWDRLSKRGHFITPKSSSPAQQELEDLTSPISTFLREKCIIEPGQRVVVDDLYRGWELWCGSRGLPGSSAATFGRDLRAAMPHVERERRRVGGSLTWMYPGIGLRG